MAEAGAANAGRNRPERAVRLICAADDRGVRVISRRRLTKVLPPSDPFVETASDAERSGFWVEVRDAQGLARYRRVIADPLSAHVEVPSEGGSFSNVRSEEEVSFALLVPDLDEGEEVVMMRGTPTTQAAGAGPHRASGEVARLPLRQG